MASKKSTEIRIKNNMGGKALIQLYHWNKDIKIWEWKVWTLEAGDTSPKDDTLEAHFKNSDTKDYWGVQVSVMSGGAANEGIYGSKNKLLSAAYTGLVTGVSSCPLKKKDNNEKVTFKVSKDTFNINLKSRTCSNSMVRIRDYSPITNVFVLMMENHSFDNLLGASGIEGLIVPPKGASNSFDGKNYPFTKGAPFFLTSDPGHEFKDVVGQLKGQRNAYSGGDYGHIDNSGFVENYATTPNEGRRPKPEAFGDVMKGFDTEKQLPVTYALAKNYMVCDQWFSSLPGPTWPNRFFLHGASSKGMDYSPHKYRMATWESTSGFEYPNKSIFQRLEKNKVPWKIYNDRKNSFTDQKNKASKAGSVPQVGALKGINPGNYSDVTRLKKELQQPYPFQYTFIEPNYGDSGKSFKGGSTQHPMDDMFGGEALIKEVYENIRNSPVWASSLLIITYDEHGGFYDSQVPPPTQNPGDVKLPSKFTHHNFNFEQLGVRVPAIVVSPLVEKGKVSHTCFDHSSVIKTILQLTKDSYTNSSPLTERDKHANDLLSLLTQTIASGNSGNNGPTTLPDPAPTKSKRSEEPQSEEEIRASLIPVEGNLQGFLQIALKFEAELLNGSNEDTQALVNKWKEMETMGEAMDYFEKVDKLIEKARAERDLRNEDSPLRDATAD